MDSFSSPITDDQSFVHALHKREMLVENRINRFRIGYFLLFALMDTAVGLDQFELSAGLVLIVVVAMMLFAAFTYFIHRCTSGPQYYPWIKYLAVSFDYSMLVGIIAVFHLWGNLLPTDDYARLAPYFEGEWSLLFALIFTVINIASGLRFGSPIVLFSTTLTLLINAYILYFGNITGQLFVYAMVASILSGVLTYFISRNTSLLFIKFLQRKRLMRFLPRDMVSQLDAGEITLELGGEMREVTVLISDIRGFTSFSEGKDPQYIVTLLNEYFTEMTHIIRQHQGMVDKFIGDGILAVFGAPLDNSQHCQCGVKAALEMQVALGKLNQRWAEEGHSHLDMGIGIHTGNVLVGNVGSPERMEYTVIGDTVNLTSRIEGLTKSLDRPILISEPLRNSLPDYIAVEFVTETQVRGRDAITKLFAVQAN